MPFCNCAQFILPYHSVLWRLESDWLEKMDIMTKLIVIPQLLFNETFSKDRQPYQDMLILNKVRNYFVHYKMNQSNLDHLKTEIYHYL